MPSTEMHLMRGFAQAEIAIVDRYIPDHVGKYPRSSCDRYVTTKCT